MQNKVPQEGAQKTHVRTCAMLMISIQHRNTAAVVVVRFFRAQRRAAHLKRRMHRRQRETCSAFINGGMTTVPATRMPASAERRAPSDAGGCGDRTASAMAAARAIDGRDDGGPPAMRDRRRLVPSIFAMPIFYVGV